MPIVPVVVATPPCQGMSQLGQRRYNEDERNYLIFDVLDIIDAIDVDYVFQGNDVAVGDYKRVMDAAMGEDTYKIEKIKALHSLGYLPIEIVALPEGTRVPMHVPMFGITNTHDDFSWLPQALESLISAEMWYPQITATVGKTYRDIVNKYLIERIIETPI